MIWYFTPYSIEGNLGKAYNDYCKLIPDNDWICLVDGDLMFLHKNWGHHFQDLVDKYPDAGIITTLVNRVGNLEQCYENKLSENPDLIYHRNLALKLQNEKYLEVEELHKLISGHILLFSKKTWIEIGGFAEDLNPTVAEKYTKNIAGVDNRFSFRVLKRNKKILLALGIYALHYYRLSEGRGYRAHLGFKKQL